LYGLTNVSNLTRDGPIPAHLLKSIAGDNWIAFYRDTKPFQDEDDLAREVQDNFQKRNYTVKNMFKQTYKTLKQIGFDKLPSSFWTKSIFTRTWSRDMLCYPPAAYDMRNELDYRVKACAHLNLPDFELTHKLLVHIYYYYMCREQPLLFREATNPSFLTAVTNAFAINARNIEYLKMMKLITSETGFSRSKIINRLYMEALEDFVKLPFDFAVDMWRFHIFDGTSTNVTWNSDWWRLR
uniref:Angiotensin-converting enzyme n=1 Tax=Brugia timori TaxID=42155 RepID=A0A0R3QCZ8_9BILA